MQIKLICIHIKLILTKSVVWMGLSRLFFFFVFFFLIDRNKKKPINLPEEVYINNKVLSPECYDITVNNIHIKYSEIFKILSSSV